MQENRKLTKPTFDNLSEEKRHLIIRTATSEFARNGFENTNINTIAEKAGISVGSLYKYFESKQDLFLFTIAHGTDVLKDVLSSIVPAALTLEEKLNALIEAIQTTSRGVPVPGDATQVMYVWVDALSNYLTVLGYPDNPDWQSYWPADVQVIGKDILRFHAAIWPAMLLALDLPLPKKLLVHGHINSGGVKMSKTLGNVVDPVQIINEYGVDAFRYYCLRHIPTMEDGDFTWERFEAVYNGELANDLGNLVSRVARMVLNYQAGVVGDEIESSHDTDAYRRAMDSLEFDKAFDELWVTVRSLNSYLENVKPWEIAKNIGKDEEAEHHVGEILAHSVGTLNQIAQMIYPFLPDTANKITAAFKDGVVREQPEMLFPKKQLHTAVPEA